MSDPKERYGPYRAPRETDPKNLDLDLIELSANKLIDLEWENK